MPRAVPCYSSKSEQIHKLPTTHIWDISRFRHLSHNCYACVSLLTIFWSFPKGKPKYPKWSYHDLQNTKPLYKNAHPLFKKSITFLDIGIILGYGLYFVTKCKTTAKKQWQVRLRAVASEMGGDRMIFNCGVPRVRFFVQVMWKYLEQASFRLQRQICAFRTIATYLCLGEQQCKLWLNKHANVPV